MFASLFLLLCIVLPAGVLLHAALCRIARGASAYALAILAMNAAFVVVAIVFWVLGRGIGAGELLLGLVFVESFTLAFLFFLIGIVNQSPTLALVRRINATPPTDAEMAEFIDAASFIGSRVSGLRDAGDLAVDGDRVGLSPRAKRVARVLSAYRFVSGTSAARAG